MFRQPVFAGSWYEGDAGTLKTYLHGVVDKAPTDWAPNPKVLIMPHAGHRFSGHLAARVAAQLNPGTVRRIVIFGPSHRHGFRGIALPGSAGYRTPLGDLPIDAELATRVRAFHEVIAEPLAHAQEHSLEVILPFIQFRLGNLPILPLVVGAMEPHRLRALIAALWGGSETLLVISSDLTHFLTGDEAAKVDLQTACKVEKAESEALESHQACGHQALSALLDEGRRRGLRFTRLGLTHSGNITGDHSRVVGYGAWAGHELKDARLSERLRGDLLRAAREGLGLRLKNGKVPDINTATFAIPLQGIGASFVTLSLNGQLRGCIGSLVAHQPLVADVVNNAVKAGFSDPRFPPVTAAELEQCEIEIAVLSRSVAMTFSSEQDLLTQLSPGEDGLILIEGDRRSTFLPKVWDSLPTPELFLNNLKRKAGLPENHWSDSVQIARYTTERFAQA
jgi:MEMO1 family protein